MDNMNVDNKTADRVLLIDSNPVDLEFNRMYLAEKGFMASTVTTVAEAEMLLDKESFSCVVMDVAYPGMKDFEGFYTILEKTDAPVLLLTERGREIERIKGLSSGAVDYIVKPCSVQELALRVMIHVRQQKAAAEQAAVLEFPRMTIDLLSRRVLYDGKEITLSNREFDLLAFLAKHPGEVESFEEIGEELMGSYIDSDRKNVMVSASRLRKKLEVYGCVEQMIETVWGRGYCFRG